MLSLSLGKPEYRLAFGAFAINVGLAVAPFIFAEYEKSAEYFVFASPLLDVSRKDPEYHPIYKSA